ncbi:hypothetical protein K504DRAFT_150505 [Pleomassaria siparia CBS 279.74]|uniref:Uncharacterized protein n=1 Tax=Pleomassaria siparia CBS 279.74 TaxID=1314801 RepID=A0A6G1KM25_9PLEO|nr:hypothetical protein K504DRAFT_150505 [Pleomassaria siparia CBS 279.74]
MAQSINMGSRHRLLILYTTAEKRMIPKPLIIRNCKVKTNKVTKSQQSRNKVTTKSSQKERAGNEDCQLKYNHILKPSHLRHDQRDMVFLAAILAYTKCDRARVQDRCQCKVRMACRYNSREHMKAPGDGRTKNCCKSPVVDMFEYRRHTSH